MSSEQPVLVIVGETDKPEVNVTLDAVLLEKASLPVVRIWRNPLSVVLGLNQDPRRTVHLFYCWRNHIPLIRRISGGGSVVHDLGNLNFSFILPRQTFGFEINVRRLYDRLSVIPVMALRSLGIPAETTPIHDIVVRGKKISGLAMRIARERLLFHGTILWKTPIDIIERTLISPIHRGFETHQRYVASLSDLGFSVKFQDFISAFFEVVSGVFGVSPVLSSPDPAMISAAELMAPALVIPPTAVDPSLNGQEFDPGA